MKRFFSIFLNFVLVLGICFIPTVESKAASNYEFSGEAHVQTYGDKAGTFDGKTLTLGTTGQGKRLEQIKINFKNNTGYAGSIEYRVHRQTYGWTNWVQNGQSAGTTGQGKRLEGIQIRLTGELANHYSIKYRVHIQTYGWSQGWQYDGALAGTEGEAKRLESLEVMLVPKTEEMSIIYRVHRQTYGWEKNYVTSGGVSGTTGQAKRLEGIEIALTGNKYSGGIEYSTHVQSYGWMNTVSNGMMSGTSGKAKRLEAIKIKLTGEISNYYDVYYRVHAQSIGWMNWAKNGEMAGTSNGSKRLEAIQIVLVKKTENAPSGYYNGIASVSNSAYLVLSKESGASHVHQNVYRERISKQYLVIDPYIDTEIHFNGYYKNEIAGSCFYHDDMPDCYQGYANGGLPEYEGIIIMGKMIDATHFKVDSQNFGTGRDKWSQFVHNGIVDVSTLDWYCLHDGKESWYECAICGKQDMTLYSNGPYMNFTELGERTSKNTCHCEEFIRKQYGILYLRPIIKQWKEGNGVYTKFGNAKIEYNRCKHPHLDDLDIGKSCDGFYYKKCSTCGAIFKK